GKVAIIATAWTRRHARGDFELYHEKRRLEPVRMLEQTVHNGRGNVIGKIAIHPEALKTSEFSEIECQDIAGDHFDVRKVGSLLPQARQQFGIKLDSDKPVCLPRQKRSHLAVAGADLDPQVGLASRRLRHRDSGFGRCRTGKYVARDASAPG